MVCNGEVRFGSVFRNVMVYLLILIEFEVIFEAGNGGSVKVVLSSFMRTGKGFLQPNQFYSSVFPVSSSICWLARVFLIAASFPAGIFVWFLKKLKLVSSTLCLALLLPLHPSTPNIKSFFMKIKSRAEGPYWVALGLWNYKSEHSTLDEISVIEELHHELNCNVVTPGNPQEMDRKLVSVSPMVRHDTLRERKENKNVTAFSIHMAVISAEQLWPGRNGFKSLNPQQLILFYWSNGNWNNDKNTEEKTYQSWTFTLDWND